VQVRAAQGPATVTVTTDGSQTRHSNQTATERADGHDFRCACEVTAAARPTERIFADKKTGTTVDRDGLAALLHGPYGPHGPHDRRAHPRTRRVAEAKGRHLHRYVADAEPVSPAP
jgi:hypothetical protein